MTKQNTKKTAAQLLAAMKTSVRALLAAQGKSAAAGKAYSAARAALATTADKTQSAACKVATTWYDAWTGGAFDHEYAFESLLSVDGLIPASVNGKKIAEDKRKANAKTRAKDYTAYALLADKQRQADTLPATVGAAAQVVKAARVSVRRRDGLKPTGALDAMQDSEAIVIARNTYTTAHKAMNKEAKADKADPPACRAIADKAATMLGSSSTSKQVSESRATVKDQAARQEAFDAASTDEKLALALGLAAEAFLDGGKVTDEALLLFIDSMGSTFSAYLADLLMKHPASRWAAAAKEAAKAKKAG